ncbi:hypothetical protein [uncultured Parolsenella sp.]|uniref:hypothetical protein n=1 Tax=uncultured Parolsenella sp. TaxID=2083008 RepID=UPI0025FE27CF|nr:hypothetical protein [uncultured Parolsenella sp.]
MSVINFLGDAWYVRVDEGEPHADALRIASALGRLVKDRQPEGNVVIGYDSRPLNAAIALEMGEVVASYGIKVRVSDVHCPASVLNEAVRRDREAVVGVMLTAGNRPADYFGVRICMADGSAATSSDTDLLESYIVPELPMSRGEVELIDLVSRYLEEVSSLVDDEVIRAQSPLVVCDPMYGAQTSIARRLMSSLGARVVEIHADDAEDFGGIHPMVAEPWIDDCEQAVTANGASYGIALDGAGERIALVDEHGNYVNPHKTLSLIMEYLVKVRGLTGRLAAPVFVSSIVRRQAERLGLPLTVTPIGYAWMREEVATGDVVCAGDAVGGVCVPQLGYERDSLAAATLLMDIFARDGRPVSQIVADLDTRLGRMEYGRKEVRLGPGEAQMLRVALPGVNPPEVAGVAVESVSHPAGCLRLGLAGGSWVLVAPSPAAPSALVVAEAPTRGLRDALLAGASSLARSPLG